MKRCSGIKQDKGVIAGWLQAIIQVECREKSPVWRKIQNIKLLNFLFMIFAKVAVKQRGEGQQEREMLQLDY